MNKDERVQLRKALAHIAEETRTFGYFPARFVQDLARSEPLELVQRYIVGTATEGFARLLLERRLDLAVENVAWAFRHLFSPEIVERARARLADAGFDVVTQTYTRPPPRKSRP